MTNKKYVNQVILLKPKCVFLIIIFPFLYTAILINKVKDFLFQIQCFTHFIKLLNSW